MFATIILIGAIGGWAFIVCLMVLSCYLMAASLSHRRIRNTYRKRQAEAEYYEC